MPRPHRVLALAMATLLDAALNVLAGTGRGDWTKPGPRLTQPVVFEIISVDSRSPSPYAWPATDLALDRDERPAS